MVRKRTSQDIGGDFEKQLQSCFSSLSKTHGFTYHKLTDTAAAGGIVQAQPSDYIITYGQVIAFLEAKASQVETKLGMAMLRPAQRGAIKHWGQLLGAQYFVVFYSEKTKLLDIVDGKLFMKHGARQYDKSLIWQGPMDEAEKGMALTFALRKIEDVTEEYRRRYE